LHTGLGGALSMNMIPGCSKFAMAEKSRVLTFSDFLKTSRLNMLASWNARKEFAVRSESVVS
jgi:hypothetical protein